MYLTYMYVVFCRHRNSKKYQECLPSLFRKQLKVILPFTRCHVLHAIFHTSSLQPRGKELTLLIWICNIHVYIFFVFQWVCCGSTSQSVHLSLSVSPSTWLCLSVHLSLSVCFCLVWQCVSVSQSVRPHDFVSQSVNLSVNQLVHLSLSVCLCLVWPRVSVSQLGNSSLCVFPLFFLRIFRLCLI